MKKKKKKKENMERRGEGCRGWVVRQRDGEGGLGARRVKSRGMGRRGEVKRKPPAIFPTDGRAPTLEFRELFSL